MVNWFFCVVEEKLFEMCGGFERKKLDFLFLLFVVYVVGFETDRKKEIRLLKKTFFFFFFTEWES